MQNLKILNKKEVKQIFSLIEKQWGCAPSLDYVFLMNKENRIFIANKELFSVDTEKIRINSLGLYFGEVNKGKLRLSIEGSQLIGKYATKNVIELDDTETREWLKGVDIDKKTESEDFVIIMGKKHMDFLGCGKCKEGRILNYVPKTRRLNVSD